MSASQFDEFDRRMNRIHRRHSKLSHGYVTQVNSDGLVVARAKRRSNGGMLRGLMLVAVVMILFKGVLHAHLGDAAYQERLSGLQDGNFVEQVGAWVMTADPITKAISHHVASLVR